MPRDLFMLFYSRFFHMAPTTTPLSKDDPDNDSKHHCRYARDVVCVGVQDLFYTKDRNVALGDRVDA